MSDWELSLFYSVVVSYRFIGISPLLLRKPSVSGRGSTECATLCVGSIAGLPVVILQAVIFTVGIDLLCLLSHCVAAWFPFVV